MSNKNNYRSVDFLNPITSDYSSTISVMVYDDGYKGDETDYNYEIRISDCNETVKLHGDLSTIEKYEDALYKIKVIEDSLKAMKAFMKSTVKKTIKKSK